MNAWLCGAVERALGVVLAPLMTVAERFDAALELPQLDEDALAAPNP